MASALAVLGRLSASSAGAAAAPDPTSLAMPAQLAADGAGRLYVADLAAERVSLVAPDGSTSVFAGGNRYAPGDVWALGGYADGPADMAHFRHIGGVAVARDGSVVVADTFNHCIRKIAGGVVTTLAGRFDTTAAVDGPLAVARFKYPKGLAVDSAGDIYVADFTAGIREIAVDGTVSTLHLPAIGADATSLAIFEGNGRRYLGVSDDTTTVIVDLATMRGNAWGPKPSAPDPALDYHALEGYREAGRMSAIAVLAPNAFAFADARSGEVNLIDNNVLGTISTEPLRSPLGIALVHGSLAVSDSGGHRIVRYRVPDLRLFSNDLVPARDPHEYRIGFMSDSFVSYDTLWEQSVPGVCEHRLRLDVGALGGRKPTAFAFRQSSIDALRSIVDDEIEPGQLDAIVLLVNSPQIYIPMFASKHWGENLANFEPQWRPQFVGELTAFAASAARKRLPLYVVVHPLAFELSPYENVDAREPVGGGVSGDDGAASYAVLLDAVRSAGFAHVDDLRPAMLAAERERDHAPLFGTYDFHWSAAGRALAGDLIAQLLEREKPWATVGSK